MAKFFAPNIGRTGRIIRAALSLASLVGAFLVWETRPWAAVLLLLAAVFTAFEAFRGWCVMRACGVKTKY